MQKKERKCLRLQSREYWRPEQGTVQGSHKLRFLVSQNSAWPHSLGKWIGRWGGDLEQRQGDECVQRLMRNMVQGRDDVVWFRVK